MHFHLMQHTPLHGPGRIADWLSSMGYSYTIFHLYAGEAPPSLADGNGLILLDGPTAGLDAEQHPWCKRERKLVAKALNSHKPLLGIGMGARMIAAELGATVGRGTFIETGWHEVTLAAQSPFDLPETFTAFMWHRDVFALPEGALPLGSSLASPVQGFAWDAGRVVGLLCHLEASFASVAALLNSDENPADSGNSPYAQSRESILAKPRHFDQLAPLLDRLLSQWLRHTLR